MLAEIFNGIAARVKEAFPAYSVNRYKGEFESETTDWSPTGADIFLRLESNKPLARDMDDEVSRFATGVMLFVGGYNLNEPAGLELVEKMQTLFNGVELAIADEEVSVMIDDNGLQFLGYVKGEEIYTLMLNVK